MIVFDSSALNAYVRGETGADAVEELLAEADVPMFVHAANLCEMMHQIWRSDGQALAEEVVRDVLSVGVEERTDTDRAFWRDAAEFIVGRRLAGASLPLGDALGVALSRRPNASFVTADRAEIGPLEQAGLVNVIFIR